jgi:hypothetical protein
MREILLACVPLVSYTRKRLSAADREILQGSRGHLRSLSFCVERAATELPPCREKEQGVRVEYPVKQRSDRAVVRCARSLVKPMDTTTKGLCLWPKRLIKKLARWLQTASSFRTWDGFANP